MPTSGPFPLFVCSDRGVLSKIPVSEHEARDIDTHTHTHTHTNEESAGSNM